MTATKWFLIGLLPTLVAIAAASPASAAPPWADLVRFQQVDANPNASYDVTQENGPWMIMATTFRGPSAERDAQQLVYELRKTHKMTAYSHKKVFDFTETLIGKGVDKYGEPKRMRHNNKEKVKEVAVLVGDYASVDDPEGQKTLSKIKSLQPKTLTTAAGRETSQTFARLREVQRNWMKGKKNNKNFGPMRLAFFTTNPTLPNGYFQPRGVDRFVDNLNRGIKHNLLQSPGSYTVKVATFSGYLSVDPAKVQDPSLMKKSRLEEGALQANRLAIALRAKGYEAYQFHDRHSSIVTVGSFDRPAVRRADGTKQYPPQVQEIIKRFSAKHRKTASVVGGPQPVQKNLQPETLLGIPFDMQPAVIEVPRRSISSDYARRPSLLR